MPIFLVFVITHGVLIAGVLAPHLDQAGPIAASVHGQLSADVAELGWLGVLLIFLRAYSLGGGTYTGIEAVSNGLQIMREPRVATAKRTMLYMAVSLAFTASGILLAYLFLGIEPSATKPMNAILAERFVGEAPAARAFVLATLLSEGALLFVAAQAGFIDGPRVMANMALDSWLPRQLASLSERLTMHRGVLLMGGAAVAVLLYTRGDVHHLVVMYSINVFLTFSLSNLGMARLWAGRRGARRRWRSLAVHLVALVLCASVLVITIFEKFTQGGWVTLLLTLGVVLLCGAVRRHYRGVVAKVRQLEARLRTTLADIPREPRAGVPEDLDPDEPTAVLLVGGYGGLGVQALREVDRIFPGHFRQVVFISVGVLDSGTFKGKQEIGALRSETERTLEHYVRFARNQLGWAATYDYDVGADVVAELERLCREVYLRFPRSVFFAGKLIFREPAWWHRLLHNETANAVQRRLEFDRLSMIVIPVRLL